ncbi:MAG: lactonase family protein [Myxococcales bacterium]|nr:lactonase family protein [Myxococcales bacterium]
MSSCFSGSPRALAGAAVVSFLTMLGISAGCRPAENPASASAASPSGPTPPPAGNGTLLAYASGYGPTLAIFAVDRASGALRKTADVPSFGPAPSFLAVNAPVTNLYALDEGTPGRVGAYRIEPGSGALRFLGAESSGGAGPAHLSLDATGRYVLVANYGDGTISVLPVRTDRDGALGAPLQTLSVGAQAHMILTDPSNRYVFVPCKGADYVAQFTFDAATGALRPNARQPTVATAAGAGPRHLAFHRNGRFAYLINELDNTMTALAFDAGAGTLSPIETQSTLPSGYSGQDTAAEVWVHPSGAWVFGSNRGDDSIVVFGVDPATGKLARKGHTKTGGAHPRDFALDPTGRFLYVANQKSNAVVPFRFDPASGELSATAAPVEVTGASYIGLFRVPGGP